MKYKEPLMEILLLAAGDVITSSNGDMEDVGAGGGGGDNDAVEYPMTY